jgi:SAM-dependent methyltransferase
MEKAEDSNRGAAARDAVRDSYDSAASAYAEHLSDELDRKPLDRALLNRFVEAIGDDGLIADLGCGPGHVAAYLAGRGAAVVGIDLSPGMIAAGKVRHPDLDLRVGDMRRLDLAEGSLAGAVLFYSIVHFAPVELGPVFAELRRVLAPGGLALIAFHSGEDVVHVDDLYGAPVSLDFRFHDPNRVADALRAAQLPVFERVEREPYEGAEYPSRRCYLLARAS